MLLLNNKQTTVSEICAKFGIPESTLTKVCEFKYNENLKGYDIGSRQMRDTQPQRFPAVFYAEDKNGITHEIRYAASKSNVRDRETKKVIEKYSPKKVQIDGDTTIVTKADFAAFLLLNKKNRQSPFRNPEDVWSYELVDKQANAKKVVGTGDLMRQALNHANSAQGKDLKLLAKGMGIDGVDEMTDLEIQGELTTLALNDAKSYLDKVGKQTTKMDGRIYDAIDKGIFKLDQTFGTPKWLWAKGENKGQLVCEVTNGSIPAQQFLSTYIKGNLNNFYAQIISIQNADDVNVQAEAFLKEKEESNVVYVDNTKPASQMEYIEDEVDEDEVLDTEVFPEAEDLAFGDEPDFPHDFKSSVAYISHYKGSNASNVQGKQLMDAIKSEEAIPSNIRKWVKDNLDY